MRRGARRRGMMSWRATDRFSRDEERECVGDVSPTDFPISRGRPSARRDAMRRRTSPRLDRRTPRDASTFDNSPTSRRKQEGMPAPRMRLNILGRARRGGRTPSLGGRVSAPRGSSDRGVAVLVSGLENNLSIMLYAVTMMSRILAVGHESFRQFLHDCAEIYFE